MKSLFWIAIKKLVILLVWVTPVLIGLWLIKESCLFSEKLIIHLIPYNIHDRYIDSSSIKESDLVKATETNDIYYQLKSNQLSFDVQTPREFLEADFKMEYQNPMELPTIKISNKSENSEVTVKPFADFNSKIDQLESTGKIKKGSKTIKYSKITDGKYALWQKSQKNKNIYKDINDFVINPPEQENLIYYNVNLYDLVRIKDYHPGPRQEINIPLEGEHTIYTYVKDEQLSFDFEFVDTNESKGKDTASIKLYRGEELLESLQKNDDGIVDDTGIPTKSETISLVSDNLPESLYRIEVNPSSDIIINSIKSDQNIIWFYEVIRFYQNNSAKFTNLYANGKKISFRASKKSGFQTVTIGNINKEITETNRNFIIYHLNGVNRVDLQSPSVRVSTKGFLSFSPIYLEHPFIEQVTELSEKSALDKYDYLIAQYQLPEYDNGWNVTEQTFKGGELNYNPKNTLRFTISVPNLKKSKGQLVIKDLEITFKKPPFYFSNFWSRIKKLFN